MANKRDLKKHAEEFGEQGGASPKTQRAIRAAFKNQPKKDKSKSKSKRESIPWGGKLPGAIKKRRAKAKKEGKWYLGKYTFDKPKPKKETKKKEKGYAETGGKIGPKQYKGPAYTVRKQTKSKLSNFGASFKKNCAGKDASHTFTWKDKKYTCAKK